MVRLLARILIKDYDQTDQPLSDRPMGSCAAGSELPLIFYCSQGNFLPGPSAGP